MKVELVTSLKRQATQVLAELYKTKESVLIAEHGERALTCGNSSVRYTAMALDLQPPRDPESVEKHDDNAIGRSAFPAW